MTIEEIEGLIANWSTWLTSRQKRHIHFNSLTNFVFHFRNLPNENIKEKVLTYLNEYVQKIEDRNALLTSQESYALATSQMNRLSHIYSSQLNFKSIMEFKFVVLFSIIGDGILYLVLRNKISFYIPIVSVSLSTYYLTRKISLEKKKKLFGLFY